VRTFRQRYKISAAIPLGFGAESRVDIIAKRTAKTSSDDIEKKHTIKMRIHSNI
jgi:hypothetical protein